jgi:hypothetical protein
VQKIKKKNFNGNFKSVFVYLHGCNPIAPFASCHDDNNTRAIAKAKDR